MCHERSLCAERSVGNQWARSFLIVQSSSHSLCYRVQEKRRARSKFTVNCQNKKSAEFAHGWKDKEEKKR